MSFAASDFGRLKRHISLQNPCASAGGYSKRQIYLSFTINEMATIPVEILAGVCQKILLAS